MGSRLESNSNAVRKKIEKHAFDNEEGEEYEGSKFGGFPDYFRRKKIKLQNLDSELRSQSTGNPAIFRGIVAHVNGYTQPSLNDLHHLIVAHGGGFQQYLDGKTTVTHIIASNLTPKKVVEFRRYRIVKPAWIVDSVSAGRLLPWDAYRVIDEGVAQKVLQFENGQIISQVNNVSKGYRDQTEVSWYTSQISAGNGQAPRPYTSCLPDHDTGNASPPANEIIAEEHAERCEPHPGASLGEDIEVESPPAELPPADNSEINNVVMPSLAEREDPRDNVDPSEPPTSPSGTKRKAESSHTPSTKRARLTAEEHNAVLLADPRIRKSSTLNPDFLEQYYRESRLHHLSTWKAALKSQLQAMTATKMPLRQARPKRAPGTRRYILHVDFDSFFVAVSLKNFPQDVDRPACVAHGSGSGSEIASCNYPARKFGVKNGMWMKTAQELCKDLKILPYDFPAYEEASKVFYEAIIATGGIVQSVSVDEALVDVTALCLAAGGHDGVGIHEGSVYREQAKADEVAFGLREKVKAQTGCAVSVGIGGNILLAKVALRKAKPAGQCNIKPEEALDLIGPLQVQDLPGVAYSIGGKLEELGIKFVNDIRECSKEKLVTALGPKTGEKLWNYSRAIDKTEVGDQVIRKSVSAEVNWGVRFETQDQAEEFIDSLCGELNRRLLKEGVNGKQLTMKIMRRAADAPLDPPKHLGHGKCDTFNKSVVLGVATNSKEVITREALSVLRSYGFSPGELRGLGIQMTKLEPIKVSIDGTVANSQGRLQFKTTSDPKSVEREVEDPIQDDLESPKKPRPSVVFGPVPPGLDASNNSPSRRPLNMLGTQFILPTQVDPSVLAELPPDIRARLAKRIPAKATAETAQFVNSAIFEPDRPQPIPTLPNHSQLDPDALSALPNELRAEILAQYAISPPRQRAGQSVLPQSPRKSRTVAPPRKGVTRGKGRGVASLLTRMKASRSKNHDFTLTQSNFVTTIANSRASSHDHVASDSETRFPKDEAVAKELNAEFLAALPEDIRKEVLAQHRAEQLRRHAGLEVAHANRNSRKQSSKHQHEGPDNGGAGIGQQRERTIILPPRPQRPTFTTKKLFKIGQLREAVSEWYDSFKEEGPYMEDVEALRRYLGSVIEEERDMWKAGEVVRWMEWVVEGGRSGKGNGDGFVSRAEERWVRAVGRAKECVEEAVMGRGLGKVGL